MQSSAWATAVTPAAGLYLDDYYLQNIEGAQAAGLQTGVYFFSQAINEEEAREEAEYVLQWVDGYDVSLPVFYDWELTTQEARTAGMDPETVTACAAAFCQTIEEAGWDAGVYFGQHTGYQLLNLLELQDYGVLAGRVCRHAEFSVSVYLVAIYGVGDCAGNRDTGGSQFKVFGVKDPARRPEQKGSTYKYESGDSQGIFQRATVRSGDDDGQKLAGPGWGVVSVH